jgi:cytoskeletal protein RodZ
MSGRKTNKDTNKATDKDKGKNKGKGVKPGRNIRSVLLFWMLFFIVMLFIFIVSLPRIRQTLRSTHAVERLLKKPYDESADASPPVLPEASERSLPPPAAATQPPPAVTDQPPPIAVDPPSSDAEPPAVETPIVEPLAVDPPESGLPAAPPPESAAQTPSAPTVSPDETPAARERVIYFVRIDAEGRVLTSPVKRTLPASSAPLTDALNALLQGVTDEERAGGLTSLVPPDVLVQSARVEGGTALVSFNESFMFNGYGAEGYIGQLRQIVWTATEFATVNDVQILIEGRRIDFLGESIRIDRPISRASL